MVDVVDAQARRLAADGFREEVEPALDLFGERAALLLEGSFLFLAADGCVFVVVFVLVEVVKYEVGLAQEADDVVPNERLEHVRADAGVVAGGSALFGSAVAGARVPADSAVLDCFIERAAVCVAAGRAADFASEEVVVSLAACVLCRLLCEARLCLFVALAGHDCGNSAGDERAVLRGAFSVDAFAGVEGAAEDSLDGESLPAVAGAAGAFASLAGVWRSAFILVRRVDSQLVEPLLDSVEAEVLVDEPGVHLADNRAFAFVDGEEAVVGGPIAVGDDSAGVAAFGGGARDAFVGSLCETANFGCAEYPLDAEHDEVIEIVRTIGPFRGCDGDRVFLAGADDSAKVFEGGVAGQAALFDHEDDVYLVSHDHREEARHSRPPLDGAATDAEVFDNGVLPASFGCQLRQSVLLFTEPRALDLLLG